jgi:hypothetical protein
MMSSNDRLATDPIRNSDPHARKLFRPIYKESTTDDESAWELSRRTLGSFYIRYGRYPRHDSDRPAERLLAAWVAAQLASELRGSSNSRGLRLALTPGWSQTRNSLHGAAETTHREHPQIAGGGEAE